MEKLEQLKKEMLDARDAYNTFIENNSVPVTEDKTNERPLTSFDSMIESNQRKFSLTTENYQEMRRLEQNVRDTQKAFFEEYTNQTK